MEQGGQTYADIGNTSVAVKQPGNIFRIIQKRRGFTSYSHFEKISRLALFRRNNMFTNPDNICV